MIEFGSVNCRQKKVSDPLLVWEIDRGPLKVLNFVNYELHICLNTQYMTNLTIVCPVKMEYG